ncbi:MAG: nucleotidyl transferase AbiEii/AbiGii toxin family protein, partial [Bifidobacteriaceae bacterium]|nr:nucleotidyl transferase AbiEii/AbiGii toxin family protein [Bifidobacteriaceae bacterium]
MAEYFALYALEGFIARLAQSAFADQLVLKGGVLMAAYLGKARIPLHVDMNFGDPVWPAPVPTKLPLLLGGDIDLLCYPVSMILAEKIVTAIERGAANTRWRDFADIAAMANSSEVQADVLAESIATVVEHRRVDAKPLQLVLGRMGSLAQAKWAAWRRKQHLEEYTPEAFQEVLDQCSRFADAVLLGDLPQRQALLAQKVRFLDQVRLLGCTGPLDRRHSRLAEVPQHGGPVQVVLPRDPVHLLMGSDEVHHYGSRGSSVRAKKLDAANRISLARRSSLTSYSRS